MKPIALYVSAKLPLIWSPVNSLVVVSVTTTRKGYHGERASNTPRIPYINAMGLIHFLRLPAFSEFLFCLFIFGIMEAKFFFIKMTVSEELLRLRRGFVLS